jgi:hypothetical protein
MFDRNFSAIAALCAAFAMAACAPLNYNVRAPKPSGLNVLPMRGE